ncbi:MAG: lysylphosphatidylglycerol synthase transmembrane domain-containing protein [Arenicellales bacterium]|nr:lysylphosphatidylglycerol synthase transmembrane domain-containing protein [Arenicellales bacterium]
MKRIIINVIKILIVAGLIVYVLSNIQWRDTLTYLNATSGEVERVVDGEILGDWDAPTIEFSPADTTDVIQVDSDAKDVRVSPGLFTYFRNLDLYYFWIGVVLNIATIIFSAVRWWWLLGVNKLNVTLFDSIRYTWLGLFFNNVIPGQTGGDIVKAIYIARRCSSDPVPAFLSVFVDRVLGLTSLALLAAIVVLFSVHRFLELAIAIWALLFVGIVIAAAFFSRRLRQRIGLRYLASKLPAKAQNLLKEVDAAIFHYRGHKKGVSVWLLLGIGNHFVLISGVVMFGFAVGVGIPVLEYYVLVPVINIVSAIPIAPSGWGIGEALYAKLFADYGAVYLADTPNAELVMSTRAIALSILFRIVITALSLLGGLALLFEKQRLSKEEIQQQAHL